MADDKQLQVELVSAERVVWSGEASFVLARTIDGEIGILPGHAPVLSVLNESAVVIRADGGDTQVAAVDGGFLSIADNRVSILAERAQLADDIDVDQARQDAERSPDAERDEGEDEEPARARRWGEARVSAVEKAG